MTVKEYMASHRKDMVDLLRGLVVHESPTGDKKAVDDCSRFFLSRLAGLEHDLLRIPQKDIGDLYVVGYPRLSDLSPKPVLILTHIDTVWPVGCIKDMPWRALGSKLRGPGVLDMKAGLVIALFALKALAGLSLRPRRPVMLFINSAEETGHTAACRWIKRLALKSACVLCLEPALPDGSLKVRRKGRLVVSLRARGKTAHAGSPHLGANALEEVILQLVSLADLRSRGTTMNIGFVSGGTQANVVPDSARAVLDFRFRKEQDKDRILARLRALSPRIRGARLQATVESVTPPMERSRGSLALFRIASRAAAGQGLHLKAGQTGGGSDASLAASLGLPTLDGLGAVGSGIHAVSENALLPSLPQRAALLAALLAEL